MSGDRKNIDLGNDKLKENIFQVPEGYFDDLKGKVMSKIDPDHESSTLDSEKLKENIFTVPDGYFEGLPQRIDSAIHKETTVKIIPLYQRNWVRYAAAAVLLLAVIIFGIKGDDLPSVESLTVSDDAIIEYLFDENLSSLDIMASVEGASLILDELIDEEMGAYSLSEFDNPELEYDFEYIEY